MSDLIVTRGNPVEITVTRGNPVVVELSYVARGVFVESGDRGDINVTNSGATWTIDNDVVTFAKMQNIATDRLLGRATAGAGDVEEITCTEAGRALLDDASAAAQLVTLGAAASTHAHGNITNAGAIGANAGRIVRTTSGGVLDVLALGTAGQVLTVNSGATDVLWAAASGGSNVTVVETIYETSQNVSPHADAKFWIVEMSGGGNGGESGGPQAAGTGGAAGGYAFAVIPASSLGASVSLTCGAGGIADQSSGGNTSIAGTDVLLVAPSSTLSGSTLHFPLAVASTGGWGSRGNAGTPGRRGGHGSGGGGGGAVTVGQPGAQGGLARSTTISALGVPDTGGGAAGGASGSTGVAGSNGTITSSGFGNGGGGGGGGTSGAGGAGGHGIRGSGGGGGGRCTSGESAGGNGGNGFIRVIEVRVA